MLASLALLLSFPQESTEPWPVTGLPREDLVCEAILAEAEKDNQVMDHLRELVDGIGPRLTSSSNLSEAVSWAEDRFLDFGIPNVRRVQWGEFPVGFDRRLMQGRVVEPIKMPLILATRAWSPGTDGSERGPLLLGPSNDEELEASRGSFQNSWVLLTGTKSPRFDSDADNFRARLGKFFDEEGIYGTVRIARNELVLTGGRYKIDWNDLPTRTQVTIPKEQGRKLAQFLEAGEAVEVEFDLDYQFTEGPIPQWDVLAEIPGSDKADELIIMGGHLDSWDGATGTNDNGTGVATTMEAARLLAAAMRETGQQPRRTIRFMLWTGEEQGLLGSLAYIRQHPEEMERISAVLVHDGGTNYLSGLNATPLLLPLFEEILEPIDRMVSAYEGDEIRFRIKEVDTLPLGIGSDHDSYLRSGVPGFFWNQAGESNYTYVHHTQHDIYDNAVPRYEEHSAKVIAMSAWRLANMDQMLPREDILNRNRENNRSSRNRKMLGVFLSEDDGLLIDRLVKDGLSEKAGLKPGDRFTEIAGQKLSSQGDLRRALREDEDIKQIAILRDGKTLKSTFNWKEKTATPLEEEMVAE
ncbi:MAG TPA: M20/M25/M40 family metallo-hydrolase [Planctomycetota bacterium]|jgi:hypothetical protein|nr:hypothetical protein [Planctomycetota bacterium]MDP7245963.1 M20/M25/M40 family metallo-hydrolase [Planctomycetota bacterium]HJM39632.1 M20/M25/M40 family metallo-hydrolase [Planctomycetota bacterium]|tara:strand:- start:69523 stop:71265 length:1743 start_codon:yes stop_codon:yes gene_type:complete